MKLKCKKLHPSAQMPTKATDGAACFDLYAVCDDNAPPQVVGGSALIKTGIAVEVPEGHVMLIFSRSGQGFKHNVRLANCVGVIDSDYRGELMTKLVADRPHGEYHQIGEYVVRTGDRIAQFMILPIPEVSIEEVEELTTSARGEGGFGHTGR